MVAVRSSGTTEDAGRHLLRRHERHRSPTCAGVARAPRRRLRDCWTSLYGERVVAYRAEGRLRDEPAIAVIVQTMVPSERSGVMFTADPLTGDRDEVVVEAVLGQGEAIVSGMVEPDTYGCAGRTLRAARCTGRPAGPQDRPRRRTAHDRGRRPAARGRLRPRSSTTTTVLDLARLGLAVEEHYGRPQDIEWAMAGGPRPWLVQARPITTLAPRRLRRARPGRTPRRQPGPCLVRGLAASRGAGHRARSGC